MEAGLIYQKIPAIMADVDSIGKDRANTQQNYKFRGVDDVMNEMHSIFVKHKIFPTTTVIEVKRDQVTSAKGSVLLYSILTISVKLFAEDGSFVESIVVGEGMDTGDKASNKALSVGYKYALLQLFCIPTEDSKDPEDDSHKLTEKNNTGQQPAASGEKKNQPPQKTATSPAAGNKSKSGAVDDVAKKSKFHNEIIEKTKGLQDLRAEYQTLCQSEGGQTIMSLSQDRAEYVHSVMMDAINASNNQ